MQNLNELLTKQQGSLNELIHHGKILKKLNKILTSLLPHFLAGQCSVASWQGDTVIIHANNGSVGTVLRYQLLRLLPLLQQQPGCHKIQHLICHIRPAALQNNGYIMTDKPNRSTAAAELLQETANNINDATLQAALRRLAQHVQPIKGK